MTPEEFDDLTNQLRGLVAAREIDRLLSTLQQRLPAASIAREEPHRAIWRARGEDLMKMGEYHSAMLVFHALYDRILEHEVEGNERRPHTGDVLYFIALCHSHLAHPVLTKRYLMLTLCDDAIANEGRVYTQNLGVYRELVYHLGLSDSEFRRYYADALRYWQEATPRSEARYPEWVLQHLDQEWMTEYPTADEAGVYIVNTRYVSHLLGRLGESKGEALEWLAQYLIGAMPGCRAYRRKRSHSTDYDVVGAFDGSVNDFRSELGRYFLCECKDWSNKADFTTMAKFCRVLDSVKARFGVLFSTEGISGVGETEYAERELLKVFQDRAIVIVVLSAEDLKWVARGGNLITLLREQYERVRLDLRETPRKDRLGDPTKRPAS